MAMARIIEATKLETDAEASHHPSTLSQPFLRDFQFVSMEGVAGRLTRMLQMVYSLGWLAFHGLLERMVEEEI